MTGIRIAAPKTAVKGEVIELKAMIQHAMETGYRRDEYGRPIPRDQGRNNLLCNFVLKVKNVLKFTVICFCPEMTFSFGIYQLSSNTNHVACFADTALYNISRSQLLGYLLYFYSLSFIKKCRIPSNNG